jgi:hypothetical protein
MLDNNVRCVNCTFLDVNNFCRRYPPNVVYSGKDINHTTNYVTTFGTAMYPVIRKPELDWCGEFKSIDKK